MISLRVLMSFSAIAVIRLRSSSMIICSLPAMCFSLLKSVKPIISSLLRKARAQGNRFITRPDSRLRGTDEHLLPTAILAHLEHQFALQVTSFAHSVRLGRVAELIAGDRRRPDCARRQQLSHAVEM